LARLARLVAPGELHLVVHRARIGGAVFHDGADRRAWHEAARAALPGSGLALHGYGLLPTEVRLLVTPGEQAALARFMQAIGRRHVRGHNDRHHASGTPWEGRFRSCVVEADRFLSCLRWVEVDGQGDDGAVADLDASSAGHHLGLWSDPRLTDHPAFWRLGNTPFEREAAWRGVLEGVAGAPEAEEIGRCARQGWVLGSRAYADRLAAQATRPTRPRPRGRPPAARAG
jgi:putative transposase